MASCGSKNGYPKDTCLEGIGLHAHKIITILCSIVDMFGMGRGTNMSIS
jgi:hypothetical protein